MIKVIHSELKSWPPDQGANRIQIGQLFVDYAGPVPTQADVDSFFALKPKDGRLATATGLVGLPEAVRAIEDLKAYLREKLG